MLVILLNCVTLGMYQPCIDDQCVTNRCKILQMFDDFIFVFFALEMSIKMIAMGVYGKGTYLADSWNRLDFFIVIAGALEYCLNVENMNLSAIRTIRVLRPLRAINRIPNLLLSSICIIPAGFICQSVITSGGIIINLLGPYKGRRHDTGTIEQELPLISLHVETVTAAALSGSQTVRSKPRGSSTMECYNLFTNGMRSEMMWIADATQLIPQTSRIQFTHDMRPGFVPSCDSRNLFTQAYFRNPRTAK